jgi:carbon monoxide dehydrogenase subunit G
MIETERCVLIDSDIDSVWSYVADIRRWASLFPGYRECNVIDEHNSHWLLKIGAGALVRSVKVQVCVNQWSGPEQVTFTYKLDGDPVKGSGSYTAAQKSPGETEITLRLSVEGSGPMAPLWEAMSKPLLPQLAKSFACKLKEQIEGVPPDEV